MRCQDIINIAVLLEYPALLLKVHELREVGGLSHCKLCDTPCWLVSNVHPGDSIFSQLLVLRVSPQESVEVHFTILKPHRVVHLLDVTQSSVHPTSELQEDCTDRVEDVRTFHQHIIQAHTSEFLAAVPDEPHWCRDQVWIWSDEVADIPYWPGPVGNHIFGELHCSTSSDHVMDLGSIGSFPFGLFGKMFFCSEESGLNSSPVVRE